MLILLQSGDRDVQMDLDTAAGEDDWKTYLLYVIHDEEEMV